MKNEVTFDQAKKTTGVALIEFYATWCPHCQRMKPIVNQVIDLLGEQVPVYTFDIDEHEDWSDEAKVETVPTFIIYNNTQEVWRHSGELTAQQLVDAVDNALLPA